MITKITDEGQDYLFKQFEAQEKAMDDLMFAINEKASTSTLNKLYFELHSFTRYIRHLIKEGNDCSTCYKAGLVHEDDASRYAKGEDENFDEQEVTEVEDKE